MLKTEYIEDISSLLGDQTDAYVKSLEKTPCRALRPNTLRMDEERIKDILEKAGIKTGDKVPWTGSGVYYEQDDNEYVRPGNHVLHEAGFYYIQEPSAMLPASLISPGENDRIMDLCAAPGGKSTQLAAAMAGRGLLISNEIIPSRAGVLSENIERMGITNAIVTNESPDSLSRRFPLFFDSIIVDAPCSGEGMFRKNPEAIDQWSRENVALCVQRQKDILEKADIMLRPGGTLIYSTCTFAYEENEGMILSFLREHPVYRLKPVPLCGGMVCAMAAPKDAVLSERPLDVADDPYDIRNAARIYPHLSDGEGHFACILVKGTEKNAVNRTKISSEIISERETRGIKEEGKRAGKTKKGGRMGESTPLLKAAALAGEFLGSILSDKDIININNGENLFLMGKQLYLLPKGAPDLQGLKILRAGLHLGSVEKDRFEPSMSLARALTVYDIINYVNFTDLSNKKACPELVKYFEGQALNVNVKKGWCLVCVEGLGVGWGKVTEGLLKNHYPKGLRKKLQG